MFVFVLLLRMFAMPLKSILGIRLGSLASGKSSGVLMPVAERVARSREGAIVTPPRPVPKMNSLINVGLKLCVSVNDRTLPGPFFLSVTVSGQFHEAVVVP